MVRRSVCHRRLASLAAVRQPNPCTTHLPTDRSDPSLPRSTSVRRPNSLCLRLSSIETSIPILLIPIPVAKCIRDRSSSFSTDVPYKRHFVRSAHCAPQWRPPPRTLNNTQAGVKRPVWITLALGFGRFAGIVGTLVHINVMPQSTFFSFTGRSRQADCTGGQSITKLYAVLRLARMAVRFENRVVNYPHNARFCCERDSVVRQSEGTIVYSPTTCPNPVSDAQYICLNCSEHEQQSELSLVVYLATFFSSRPSASSGVFYR